MTFRAFHGYEEARRPPRKDGDEAQNSEGGERLVERGFSGDGGLTVSKDELWFRSGPKTRTGQAAEVGGSQSHV